MEIYYLTDVQKRSIWENLLAEERAGAKAPEAARTWETASLHGWCGRGPGRSALSGWATPFVHETLASSLPELPYPMTARPSSLSQDATSIPCGPPGPAWKAQHQGPLKSLLPAAGQNPACPVPGVLPRDLPQPWPWSSQSYKPPSLRTPGWQEPSTGCAPPVPTVPRATPG